jgi:ABC-2 type transport system ATP-binding protein
LHGNNQQAEGDRRADGDRQADGSHRDGGDHQDTDRNPRDAAVIQARALTKRYGTTVAVDALGFDVRPGAVTGFLGPNGSGKSTTMRMIMGLDRPDAGTARINGRPYHELRWPLREVGALLEARTHHPGRTAERHLAALAASIGMPRSRVDAVLETVGLADVAGKRAGGFSLGMSQRLGIAAALLGDPAVLLFDEPVNGLDPEGVRWIRTLMKSLAAEGRTVLLSSHLISEMALTADHLVVIGRGRLLADTSVAELTGGGRSLEEAFFALTGESAQYRGAAPAHPAPAQPAPARPGSARPGSTDPGTADPGSARPRRQP